MDTRDPMDRLSSAYRMQVDPETKERHVAEVGAAIRTAPPAPVPAGFGLRRRIAAAVATIFIVAPAGMALAAEDAVPGDILYPVKELTERVRSYVDSDVEATHRVEEVERLVYRRAPSHAVERAVERAEAATVLLPDSGELRLRLELARERLQQQDEEQRIAERDGSGEGQQGPDSDTKKADPSEGSGTTAPSGPSESGEQDQGRSGTTGTTGTTLGQGQTEQGSGEGAGAMGDSNESSSTATPGNGDGSSHPQRVSRHAGFRHSLSGV